MQGHGNSNSAKEYEFIDEEITEGKYLYRLKQIDNDGKFSYSNEVEVELNVLPTEYVLYQNYPNPFNPSTTIKFGLQNDSKVTLVVFNILGEKVAVLINQVMAAGYHNYHFNGKELSSGVYYYAIRAGDFSQNRKMILMR